MDEMRACSKGTVNPCLWKEMKERGESKMIPYFYVSNLWLWMANREVFERKKI